MKKKSTNKIRDSLKKQAKEPFWQAYNKIVNQNNPSKEFDKLMSKLEDTSKWTVAEKTNHYGFFIHGWYGRTNEAAYQKENNEKV